ncbi:MAG: HNH endonuclease [Methanobrevibacter sp.]|nr:HNH endonuclease [Methanobrevibacter sp.]
MKRQKLSKALRKHQKTKHFIKSQLINKNGAVCAICGQPIKDMKDCTIDHIRPISKGGLTIIENCQLSHKKCNQAKGSYWDDKEYEEELNR